MALVRSKEAAFEGEDYKRQAEAFGGDPYPLGIRENKKNAGDPLSSLP